MAAKSLRLKADEYRVPDTSKFSLSRVSPDKVPKGIDKASARALLKENQQALNALQEVLFAQGKHAILVVIQAMDTGGKDGTIRRVFGPLNPQGVRVTGFKAPTAEELDHDYLWRIHTKAPARGMIRIFNRSHYEDVLIVRVHNLVPRKQVEARYEQINAFEKHLAENGVTILKFYLHISKDEQKERLQARLDRPDKHWKFNTGDLEERKLWSKYMQAYNIALRRCSTPHAPWYVIPANRKWYRDAVISSIVLERLKKLKLRYPDPEPGLDKIRIED